MNTTAKNFSRSRSTTPASARSHLLLGRRDRLMRRPPRAEPVSVFGKRPVPVLLQHLRDGLLDESVQYPGECPIYRIPPRSG